MITLSRLMSWRSDRERIARRLASIPQINGARQMSNPLAARLIEPCDLELYAINTGEFYERHKELAATSVPLSAWQDHLMETVIPHYNRRIEPVTYDFRTIADVASNLADYYKRHVSESA